jgi:death-on-curing protein
MAGPEKAAAYAFLLARNHPSVDGNTRTVEAAMLVFFELNGLDEVDDQDRIPDLFEQLAAGSLEQGVSFDWVRQKSRARHTVH